MPVEPGLGPRVVKVGECGPQGRSLFGGGRIQRRAEDPLAVVERARVSSDPCAIDRFLGSFGAKGDSGGGGRHAPFDPLTAVQEDGGALGSDGLDLPVVEPVPFGERPVREVSVCGERHPPPAPADEAAETQLPPQDPLQAGGPRHRPLARTVRHVAIVAIAQVQGKEGRVRLRRAGHPDVVAFATGMEAGRGEHCAQHVLARDVGSEEREAPEGTLRRQDGLPGDVDDQAQEVAHVGRAPQAEADGDTVTRPPKSGWLAPRGHAPQPTGAGERKPDPFERALHLLRGHVHELHVGVADDVGVHHVALAGQLVQHERDIDDRRIPQPKGQPIGGRVFLGADGSPRDEAEEDQRAEHCEEPRFYPRRT